jgi:hydrogenase expression/formation protein HypC
MCWAVPMRIVAIDGDLGKVDVGGAVRQVGLQLVDSPAVGDYVLVHAGFAIQKIDEDEARETLALFDEMFGSDAGQHRSGR